MFPLFEIPEAGQLTFAVVAVSAVFSVLTALVVIILLMHKKKVAVLQLQQQLQRSALEQQLLQSQVEVQESTMSTLAAELHDNVGQVLIGTKMILGTGRLNEGSAVSAIVQAEATLGRAINELRTLSKSLNKEWLKQFSLVENLSAEIKRINDAKAIRIDASYPDELPLNNEKQILLFRMLQEAIQNAIKHGAATELMVDIYISKFLIAVDISDNGKGLSPNHKSGHGFTNMRKRAEMLNGKVEWSARDGGGCMVRIEVPVV